MTIYQPYVYLIGWTELDTFYIGSEYSSTNKIANPQNIWKTYFTSSERVKSFHKEHGNPNLISIRKIFKTAEEAICYERKLLKRFIPNSKKKFLNVNLGNGYGIHDEISKSKISNKLKNKAKSQSHKENLSKAWKTRDMSTEYNRRCNIGIAFKGKSQIIITCPHCNTVGGQSAMKRWHFDYCKHKS